MKLIIGLGNPGAKYEYTRHNLGFLVVDHLATKLNFKYKYNNKFKADIIEEIINGKKVVILKPMTYMNLSGEAVKKVVEYYNIDLDNIIVVVDDFNLPVGKIRLREFGSDGGHNGLKNIDLHLNSNRYKRIRIGIGDIKTLEVNDYVLGKIPKSEIPSYRDAIEDSANALMYFIEEVPYLDIMTRYNTIANNK